MRARAVTHSSRRLKPFTLAVMAAALLGQISAFSHEAAVRHFLCAEHGELTHVAIDGTKIATTQGADRIGSQEAQ
jgi:hypothetical protein